MQTKDLSAPIILDGSSCTVHIKWGGWSDTKRQVVAVALLQYCVLYQSQRRRACQRNSGYMTRCYTLASSQRKVGLGRGFVAVEPVEGAGRGLALVLLSIQPDELVALLG